MTDANVQELHHSHDEDVRLVRGAILGLEWTEAKQAALDHILSRYDALVVEHEAAHDFLYSSTRTNHTWADSHDHAERVMKGGDGA